MMNANMGQLSFKDLYRSGTVTRWHSVATLRQLSLAEHHYLVALLTNWLCEEVLGATAEEKTLALEWALRHDTPELVMGDISTPTKQRIPKAIIEEIENSICMYYAQLKDLVGDTALAVAVKLADLIDAYVFIHKEGTGEHAQRVEDKVLALLHGKIAEANLIYPQYPWGNTLALLQDCLEGPDGSLAFE